MGRLLLCGLAAALGAGLSARRRPPRATRRPRRGAAICFRPAARGRAAPPCARPGSPTSTATGRDDLVVWSAPDVASAAGPSQVLVAYGPVDRAAPQYHVVLDVAAAAQIQAWGVTLGTISTATAASISTSPARRPTPAVTPTPRFGSTAAARCRGPGPQPAPASVRCRPAARHRSCRCGSTCRPTRPAIWSSPSSSTSICSSGGSAAPTR